jgi:CheY-like chemotaxis protein
MKEVVPTAEHDQDDVESSAWQLDEWSCSNSPVKPLARDRQSVLVVDDEPILRQLIARALLQSGYLILEAANASEAQVVAESQGPIDLLLTDFAMEGTNGLELALWFRYSYPATRVLLVSGAIDEAGRLFADAAQIQVLNKPFSVKQLLHVVQEALA